MRPTLLKTFRLALPVILITLLATPGAFACTTFVLKDNGKIYFGRNLDWDWEDGLVIANPRGLKKTALVEPGRAAAQWTSKYGSVTFNQFGLEEPFGGMNEAGLVVENMMLFESSYPAPDSRPEIELLQWIQYQLDTCSTVAEVIATDARIRQAKPTVPARIHYLVCDASGDCATIEFLNGKMVVHHGNSLPYLALANDTYASSAAYAQTNPAPKGFSGHLKNTGSLQRFACAAGRAAEFKAQTREKDVAGAFGILEQVRQGKGTVWQLVYDVPSREIHYRTTTNPRNRTVRLGTFDFASSRTVQFTAINADPPANGQLQFAELTEARHRNYLETFFAKESLKKGMGDLTPRIDLLLAGLRTYTFAEPQP